MGVAITRSFAGYFAIFGAYALVSVKSKKIIALLVGVGIRHFGAFKLMNRGAEDIEGSTSNRILFLESWLKYGGSQSSLWGWVLGLST